MDESEFYLHNYTCMFVYVRRAQTSFSVGPLTQSDEKKRKSEKVHLPSPVIYLLLLCITSELLVGPSYPRVLHITITIAGRHCTALHCILPAFTSYTRKKKKPHFAKQL